MPGKKQRARPESETEKAPSSKVRGAVKTFRLDQETLKALRLASIEQDKSQQDIMMEAVRKHLGLKPIG